MALNSVSSNVTGLAYAEEKALKVLPTTVGGVDPVNPTWYGLEPNSYADMGASLSTIARTPITNTRQQAKGTITDLDAKVGFQQDFTQRNLTRLLQGFFFADAFEKPTTDFLAFQPWVVGGAVPAPVPITAVAVGAYDAAAGLDIFKVGHLCNARNFGQSQNNGLFPVTSVAAGVLGTSKTLVVEAAPPANAVIEAVGYQFAATDLAMTIVSGQVVLTSAAVDLTTLKINIGEWLYVGGDGAGTQFAASTNKPFFGRVAAVTATTISLDRVTVALSADAGTGKTIQIFFGKLLQNSIVPTNIKRRTFSVERQLGSDGVGTQSEVVVGSVPNEIVFNVKEADKINVDLTLVGMDVEFRDGTTGIHAGTRVASPFEDAYNTSHDVIALLLSVVDPTNADPNPLFAFASDVKLTLKNNVTPNKAIAVLGAFEATAGNFQAEGSMTAYFSTVAAAQAIRNNADIAFTAIMGHKNSGFVIDLPLLQLGNGMNKVEKDKPIYVDLTQTGAKNVHGYTAAMTFFDYLPTVAMPV